MERLEELGPKIILLDDFYDWMTFMLTNNE
jgi:hypothetical protein